MQLTDKTGANLRVTETPSAYEAYYEDGTRVGVLEFHDVEGDRVFTHTEVPEEFGGRGIASALIRKALLATFDEGKTVVPECSAVRGFVEKFPEELAGEVRLSTAEGS